MEMNTVVKVVAMVTVLVVAASSTPINKCTDSTVLYYAHSDSCQKYYQCAHGNPVEKTCFPGTVFNEKLMTCVHAGSMNDQCTPQNPVRSCELGEATFIHHPEQCQLYYNCSDTSPRSIRSYFTQYMNECEYPLLFDAAHKKCLPFYQTVCGERHEPKWECEYLSYQCMSSHCIPCKVRYPSCVDKGDGFWPHQVRTWSPYYVECKDERAVSDNELRCPVDSQTGFGQIFHFDLRKCLPPWEIPFEHGGIQPTCPAQGEGYFQVKGIPIIAYHCPGEEKYYCEIPYGFPGSDISLCTRLYY